MPIEGPLRELGIHDVFQLLDLSGLGTWGGALFGLVVYELCAYGYHRGMHSSTVLWRALHQMHHSAERVDTYGAFWFSPLDMVGWTAVSSFALTVVVGLSAEAATVVLLMLTLLAVFQHANILDSRTAAQNIAHPLEIAGVPRARREARVARRAPIDLPGRLEPDLPPHGPGGLRGPGAQLAQVLLDEPGDGAGSPNFCAGCPASQAIPGSSDGRPAAPRRSPATAWAR